MQSRYRMRDMRTSEADRERVADFLRDRCAEGRLTADELSERLDAVWSSRTYGELEWLVQDLPGGRAVLSGALPSRRPAPLPVARTMRPVGVALVILAAVAVVSHVLPILLAPIFIAVGLVAVVFAFSIVAFALAPALLVLAPLAWILHRLLRHRPVPPSMWGSWPPHSWGSPRRRPYRRF